MLGFGVNFYFFIYVIKYLLRLLCFRCVFCLNGYYLRSIRLDIFVLGI